MTELESGVKEYFYATATVANGFPIDYKGNLHASCSMCFYYSSSSNRCNLTHEPCFYPDKYVNGTCPFLAQMKDFEPQNENGGDT